MGIHHEIEGLVFLFAPLKEFRSIVVILFRTAAGIELGVVVGEVPLKFEVGSGVADFAENAREVAILLKGSEDSGNVLWELVEAKATAVESISSGGDDTATGSANRDVDVGVVKTHALGGELTKIGREVFGGATEKGEDFVAEIVGCDEEDTGGLVFCSQLREEEGKNDCDGFHERALLTYVGDRVWVFQNRGLCSQGFYSIPIVGA